MNINECPSCESDNIELVGTVVKPNKTKEHTICNNCGTKFINVIVDGEVDQQIITLQTHL